MARDVDSMSFPGRISMGAGLPRATRLRALRYLAHTGNLDIGPILGLIAETDVDRIRHALTKETTR